MYNNGNSSKNVRGSEIIDGTVEAADLATAVNNDIADGVAGKATAELALPKTGGALTGAITTNSTFDGRDVGADGIVLDAAPVTTSGTWIPRFQTTNLDITGLGYYLTTGIWTKTGNMVTIYGKLATTAAASVAGTGSLQIINLPFAVSADHANAGLCGIAPASNGRWTVEPALFLLNTGTTAAYLLTDKTMSTYSTVADMLATNGTNYNILTITATYRFA
jgi:hypothetical protein